MVEAFGQKSEIEWEGTVTHLGCDSGLPEYGLNGTVMSYTVSENYSQTIQVCKFGDRYFRIVEPDLCPEMEGEGIDPITGDKYRFRYACDIPRPCESPDAWGNTGYYYVDKLTLSVEGTEYNIRLVSKNAICNLETFVPEEKKVEITTKGTSGIPSLLMISIPRDILDGNFTVLVDGKAIESQLKRSEGTTDITITIDSFGDSTKEIEIIGTKAIPEFGYLSWTVIGASALTLLLIRKNYYSSSFRQ